MLAVKCTDKTKIRFPVLATPKLDGVRCLIVNGKAVSRSFKPIPNKYIRKEIERYFRDGCDGELMIPGKSFSEATGIIMSSKNAKPTDFEYWVFDFVIGGATEVPYEKRMELLKNIDTEPHMHRVLPVLINTIQELDAFEADCLKKGFEGAMIRTPNSPYKCGRSTEREGYLLKIKQFEDSEAIITGFTEKMRNENEALTNVFGRTERKKRKDGLVAAGTLGNILVTDLKTKIDFEIGSGFDDNLRKEIWGHQKKYLGTIVKYKHQPYGRKEKPRFPIFIGFRHPNDM